MVGGPRTIPPYGCESTGWVRRSDRARHGLELVTEFLLGHHVARMSVVRIEYPVTRTRGKRAPGRIQVSHTVYGVVVIQAVRQRCIVIVMVTKHGPCDLHGFDRWMLAPVHHREYFWMSHAWYNQRVTAPAMNPPPNTTRYIMTTGSDWWRTRIRRIGSQRPP